MVIWEKNVYIIIMKPKIANLPNIIAFGLKTIILCIIIYSATMVRYEKIAYLYPPRYIYSILLYVLCIF